MIVSDRLNNIKDDLEQVKKKAKEDLGIDVVVVFETGVLKEEDEKRVRKFLNETYESYSHKPRKYISIYPLNRNVSMLLKDSDYGAPMTNNGLTQVLHDMAGANDYTRYGRHSGMCRNLYEKVIVELDTNYVDRLSNLKNHGSEITFHLERDILTALSDIKDDYGELSQKILNNLMANISTTKEYIRGRNNVPDNNYVGQGNESDLTNKNYTYYNRDFLKILDLTIMWYINHKIVQQNVSDKDIFYHIDKILRIMDRVRGFNKVYYFKTLLSGDIDIKKDSVMDVLFNRVYLDVLDNNPYERKNLKYKPMYLNSDSKSILHSDGTSSDESSLISEASLVSFDVDSNDMVQFIGECVILEKENLIAESIFDMFKKSDSKKIIELAREVDQIAVEFEFMYDQYSKSDAMHRAYDCLDRIDKKMNRADTDEMHDALDGIRSKLLEIIKKNRNRNIKKQRMTINIDYPKGYGMNA
jgi:hypothetical protein